MTQETNKILIEQGLYGFTDLPVQGEDYIIEAISQYLDSKNPKFTLGSVLNESITFSDDLSKYAPLIEAVDKIKNSEVKLNEAEKEDDQVEKNKLLGKCVAALKDAVTWWYRADSPTIAKNLRLITRVVFNVAVFVIKWKMGIGAHYADIIRNFGGKIHSNKLGDLADSKMFKQTLPGKVVELPMKDLLTGKNMQINVVNACINLLMKGIERLDHEAYYQINLKDLDANIARLDKLVDEFQEAIDDEIDPDLIKSLKKGKQDTINALRDLLLVKEEKMRRDANKEKVDKLKEKIFKPKDKDDKKD